MPFHISTMIGDVVECALANTKLSLVRHICNSPVISSAAKPCGFCAISMEQAKALGD